MGAKRLGAPQRAERGTISVIVSICLMVMAGMLALVLDLGYAFGQRRLAQNAADSASLAGAHVIAAALQDPGTRTDDDLRRAIGDVLGSSSGAFSSGYAATYVLRDGTTMAVGNGTAPIPTTVIGVTVTPAKSMSTFFASALGFNSMGVAARASARVYAVSGIDQSHPDYAPYAVWGGEDPKLCPDGVSRPLCLGDTVTYRSNSYAGDNVITGTENWTGNANSFKGFLHKSTGFLTSSSFVTSGGNAFGEEPLEMMQAHWAAREAGSVVIMPVVDREEGNGSNAQFRIAGFVAVKLINRPEPPGSHPWTAQIVAGPASYDLLTSATPPAVGTFQLVAVRLSA